MAPWSAAENKLKTVPAGLDLSVVETRLKVAQSSVPHRFTTVRKLRDYLPPPDQRATTARSEAVPATSA